MANEETQQEERQENGHDARRTVVRAAAIAAASGATALAAKKALSHDSGSSEKSGGQQGGGRDKGGGDDGSMMSSMMTSAWSSARDSLLPMLEDAAGQAGEYLAKNSPEVVRDTIVPRFIKAFERGRGSSSNDDECPDEGGAGLSGNTLVRLISRSTRRCPVGSSLRSSRCCRSSSIPCHRDRGGSSARALHRARRTP